MGVLTLHAYAQLIAQLSSDGVVIRRQVVGVYGGGGTPGPFSNPVVKPTRADGTGGVAPWETRSMPTL
jgi:hypothetical protein